MAEGKILIVDDEPDVVTYLTAVLENAGYTAYSAANADDGFEMLKVVEPDLICLDVMMPHKLGLTMYLKMKKEVKFQDLPVLIISGVTSEAEFEFRKLVPDESIPPPEEYIEKPINRKQFLDCITRLIEKKKKIEN
jgi:two-component system cell cycle response regulator DivK